MEEKKLIVMNYDIWECPYCGQKESEEEWLRVHVEIEHPYALFINQPNNKDNESKNHNYY